MTRKTYTINDKTYYQQPLVLGQLPRLLEELSTVRLTDLSPKGVLDSIGERLPRLLACVLVPEGKSAKESDVDELASEFLAVPVEVALDMVADFFACNPLSSLLERLRGTIKEVSKGLVMTGLAASSASSPEAT